MTLDESMSLTIKNDGSIETIFDKYPAQFRPKMDFLRRLVEEVAADAADVSILEETLKWGEPSFVTKFGSTIRMDWKPNNPTTFAMYFICNTRLIETFSELYPNVFRFGGDRAILFEIDDEVPDAELRHCILLALTYHRRKKLPMLGAVPVRPKELRHID